MDMGLNETLAIAVSINYFVLLEYNHPAKNPKSFGLGLVSLVRIRPDAAATASIRHAEMSVIGFQDFLDVDSTMCAKELAWTCLMSCPRVDNLSG